MKGEQRVKFIENASDFVLLFNAIRKPTFLLFKHREMSFISFALRLIFLEQTIEKIAFKFGLTSKSFNSVSCQEKRGFWLIKRYRVITKQNNVFIVSERLSIGVSKDRIISLLNYGIFAR